MRCLSSLRGCSSRIAAVLVVAGAAATSTAAGAMRPATFCNPIDLHGDDREPRVAAREAAGAADPTVLFFKGEYWIFTAQGERYWHSRDFVHFSSVWPKGLPAATGAPGVAIAGGRILLIANGVGGLYATGDPLSGAWTKVADTAAYVDPGLFIGEDGRVFLFYGDGENGPIRGLELDPAADFKVMRGPIDCIVADADRRGWEVFGEENRGTAYRGRWRLDPWLQGASMTRHAGRYYLQYSAPSPGFPSHADGVFVSADPLGPFAYAPYSPFSHKPTGFVSGAAHGSTFADALGALWHAAGLALSPRRGRGERVAIFPLRVLADGQLVSETYLGDYPQYLPGVAGSAGGERSPGWMLLSRHKPATASSMVDAFSADLAFDENAGTQWSAALARPGEWLQVDLGKRCRIEALQLAFGVEELPAGAAPSDAGRSYRVEASRDGRRWHTIAARQGGNGAALYDYVQLERPVQMRYVRIVDTSSARTGRFALAEMRVFGHGRGARPHEVQGVVAARLADNHRRLGVTWSPAQGADFHIVRYGLAPDRLFNNYQVYGENHIEIDSLNVGVPYYVAVDAVNDSGVRRGRTIVLVK